MKWIKASDRLGGFKDSDIPEWKFWHPAFCKIDGQPAERPFFRKDIEKGTVSFSYIYMNGNFSREIEEKDFNRIEWLDETNTADAPIDGNLELAAEKDLYDQVRSHIRKDKLYDWSEAMTDNEMTYLENLLLTFNPLCPPGSIGYEEQVRHIARHQGANSSQHGEWQICPKCNGTKILHPPYEVRGLAIVTGACDVCSGIGMVVSPQSTPIPPGILDKLRAANPYKKHRRSILFKVWNVCCDTLATLLSEKGEIKKEEGK